MVEVSQGLLLGSMGDVLALLGRHQPHKVSHLLSILNKPIDWSELKTPQGSIMVKFISAPDLPSSDLLSHFPSCVQFIEESVESGTVLVHCEYGISRSATMVLAYLMKKRKMTFSKALDLVKERKPDIRPNVGFTEQLKLWEAMNYKLDEKYKPYRAYVLHHQALAMKYSGYVESMQMSPDPSVHEVDSPSYYKCRKCRRLLFTDESVLQHDLGAGDMSFSKHRHSNKEMLSYFVLASEHNTLTADTLTNTSESVPEESLSGNGSDELKPDNEQIGSCSQVDIVSTKSTDMDLRSVLENPDDTLKTKTIEGSPQKMDNIPNSKQTTDTIPSPDMSIAEQRIADLAKLRAQVASMKLTSSSRDDAMCSSFFIEPVEWMAPLLVGHKDGKLSCPKCSSRIGTFDWAGIQCSCGRWVTPAFKIVKSKIDRSCIQ